VDIDKVHQTYGMRYDIVIGDLHQMDVLRVLDMDGTSIFNHLNLDDLGEPVSIEIKEMEGQF
jgi:hypothetical protein